MKKILGLLLTLCFMVALSVPTFAAENNGGKGLEGAITAVKSIIKVPETMTVFNYSYNENQFGGIYVKTWNFEWTDKGGNNTISAVIDSNYNLVSYFKSVYDNKSDAISATPKSKAIKNAEIFLKKTIVNVTGEIKLIDDSYNYFGDSNTFNFTYRLFENKVPVSYATMRIGVDKKSGEVVSFWGWDKHIPDPVYPTLSQVIGKEVAKRTYIDKLDVPLKYYSYYDYQKRTLKIFPAYNVADNMYKGIDAKTGQILTLYLSGGEGGGGGGNGPAGGGKGEDGGTQELTKEEIDAVNNAMKLITKERAESIIRSYAKVIPSSVKVTNSSITKSYFEKDKLTWDISFDESAYGSVNAKTGELVRFYYYGVESGSLNMSKDEAKGKAEVFVKALASDKFAQTVYSDSSTFYQDIRVDNPESYNFTYIRQVNKIEFPDNSISVTVSSKTGQIIQYDCNWYENETFPSVERVMSKSDAFQRLDKVGNFNLSYILTDKEAIGLIYNFVDLDFGYYLDPFTGQRLDWTGELYKDQKAPEYTDITGHWGEKTIRTLLENGYYTEGNLFRPNSNSTQAGFLKYLYTPILSSYKTDEEFYDMLASNGILTSKEKKPNMPITRQDAAKFAVRYMGYGKLATKTTIFKSVFKDSVDKKYIGYATICYGMDVMKADDNGYFNGKKIMTNAEAALVIFNLLKNK